MTITEAQRKMWAKADSVTKPSPDEQPPTYGAHHRQARKRAEADDRVEAEGPKLEAIGAE
jgi:hypothetical protein